MEIYAVEEMYEGPQVMFATLEEARAYLAGFESSIHYITKGSLGLEVSLWEYID